MEVFPPELRAELWSDDVPVRSAGDLLGAPGRGIAGLQRLDIETYLPGDLLPKADIASMAHSLELRSPLLDHEVVELGLGLPDSLRTRGRRGKIALRRAFAFELPEVVASRGKSGFGVPLAAWFRGELRDVAGDLLLGSSRGLFRRTTLERLLSEHASGRADHGHRLWTLVMLELWQQRYVDTAVTAQAVAVS
jgi:asparagine synthase (glutamine-hydrolysing)